MQISVSSTLTVYHNGQFWVGLAEHVEGGRYGVARIVFRAEPSDEEILQLIVGKWEKLAFFGDEPAETGRPARKPQATRPRGVESPQAARDEHQGAADARGTAGSDEAGICSRKKPTPRGRGGGALRAAKVEAQAETSRALIPPSTHIKQQA